MKATVLRNADTEFGCFGYLRLDDAAGQRLGLWCTAEDDWLNNKPGVSCIPPGRYLCRRTIFQKHNLPTFEITGVPGRSLILLHPGNTEEDVEGCVLLGRRFGSLTVVDEDNRPHLVNKWAVVESKAAFTEFMKALEGVDEFPIDVTWSQPGAWRVA
jgi:hypothetical protein